LAFKVAYNYLSRGIVDISKEDAAFYLFDYIMLCFVNIPATQRDDDGSLPEGRFIGFYATWG